MRILFLSQLLPLPLDAGPKIRAYYVLRYLIEAGHQVSLLCFRRPGDREKDVSELRRICAAVETVSLVRSRLQDSSAGLRSLLSKTPFLILRDQIEPMQRGLERLMARRSFDALHADQLWMAPYSLRHAGQGLRVLDQHNAVFLIPQRMATHERNPLVRALLRTEATKLEVFERNVCRSFDHVAWVTDQDRQALGIPGEHPRDSCHRVIPIATDTSTRCVLKRPQPFRVTFLGGMHWPPNAEGITWFVEQVWPRVAKVAPSALLTLIGKGAPKKVRQQALGLTVEITGYVEGLEQYLAETAAFIVPLRSGAGMRVKILDAWSWGLPVVSTSVGAEGIGAVHGENLLIANDAESFAHCLVRVMQERALAQRLSENGRAAVEMHYDWRKVYKAWDQIYH
jgi:glycosyltransferase involved in cell wall biosynthesis